MSGRAYILLVMDIFTIWTIRHENWDLLICLGAIDVASHQAVEGLQLDSDILF